MPMVNTRSESPNDELLGKGIADFGVALINNVTEKRLNEKRSLVEQQIRDSQTYQDALTAIESAPHQVKGAFEQELLERAKARFPEQELISVLTPDGGVRQISQEKGRPLTNEQIEAQGFMPATQHLIVSTDPKTGEIEIHDTALGMGAAGEDMERLQEMFPDRQFQISQAPETEVFMNIRDQQLRKRAIDTQNQSAENRPSVAERILNATIDAEIANDPLVTSGGATVLHGARPDIIQRFKDLNGQFESGVFSLDNPETQALVQNGIKTASSLVARGYAQERAVDAGFNMQLASGVVRNLLRQQALDNGVINETKTRFGIDPQGLFETLQAVESDPVFQGMREFDPKDPDADIFEKPVNHRDGQTVLRFIKVNGRVVPMGKR